MLKHYAKELTIIGLIFSVLSYSIYVLAAPKQKEVLTATRGHEVEAPPKAAPAPAPKDAKAAKPVVKKEAAKPAEPAKKEHKKKPTLKKKYADKK